MRPFLHNFIVFVCFGAALVASFLFGVRDGKRRAATDDVQHDTIVLRDTIRIPAPRPSSSTTQGTIMLALQDALIATPDTLHSRDTIYVQLPREVKTYGDSSYRAVVSGFHPSLDEIEIYQRTKVVTDTRVIRSSPWVTIGPSVGVGIATDGSVYPFLGVSATIPLWSWPRK